MTARIHVSAFAAAFLWLCLLLFALHGEGQQVYATGNQANKLALLITLSTEPSGYLTPCGCSKPMIGGMLRRATLLHSLRRQGSLINLENGDLTQALGRQDELKAEALVEMYNEMDYAAVNVGEKDFRLGIPYLEALRKQFKGCLLSANTHRQDGTSLFQEVAVVRKNVGSRSTNVVITGVLSDQFRTEITLLNPEVSIESPSTALRRLMPDIIAKGEIRILLYHGRMAEAVELAKQFPQFSLIICAHEGDHPVAVKRVSDTQLMCSGQDGKHIGVARVVVGKVAWETTYRALGPELVDDPQVSRLKLAYLERVEDENLMDKLPRSPTLNGDTFIGSMACKRCHQNEYSIWQKTSHARALQSLVEVRQDKDPECVICHVVGLDRQSGFRSHRETRQLENVGCESCHGPCGRHVRASSNSPLPKVRDTGCVGCHSAGNSPSFQFARYWIKISH